MMSGMKAVLENKQERVGDGSKDDPDSHVIKGSTCVYKGEHLYEKD